MFFQEKQTLPKDLKKKKRRLLHTYYTLTLYIDTQSLSQCGNEDSNTHAHSPHISSLPLPLTLSRFPLPLPPPPPTRLDRHVSVRRRIAFEKKIADPKPAHIHGAARRGTIMCRTAACVRTVPLLRVHRPLHSSGRMLAAAGRILACILACCRAACGRAAIHKTVCNRNFLSART